VLLGLAIAACWDRGQGARDPGARGQVGRQGTAGSAVVRLGGVAKTRWRTVTLPVVVPYVVGIGLLTAAFQHWYGSPDPQVPYHGYAGTSTIGTGGWDFWYEFALRDLLNPIVGWIPFAPVHWLGFAGLGCLVVFFGWPAAACVAVAGGYELLVASVGPSVGWGFPARYTMIIVPLIAIPLAVAIQKVRPARVAFVPLLALSFVFAVAAVRDYGHLYPVDDTQRIFGLRSTATAFPITHQPDPNFPPTSFTLAPGQRGPQTGRVRGGQVVATGGRDGPGFVLFGPYVSLKSGAYQARFSLAASGVRQDEVVATIEATGQTPGAVFAREVVTGRQLRQRRLTDFRLPFAAPGGHPVETRVYYHGNGTLRAGPVQVDPIAAAPPLGHFRDWPLTFLWVAGTVFVGWLFVQVMKLTRDRGAHAQPRKRSHEASSIG
jgi:hypothetical protein